MSRRRSSPTRPGSTSIKADVFDRNWQEIFGITYGDVQWAETGEYFTEESWHRIRKERPGQQPHPSLHEGTIG